MRLRTVILAGFLLSLFSGVAAASVPIKNKLQTLESQLDQKKAAAAALDLKAKETNEDLRELQHKLIAATDALGIKESEQGRLEDRLEELARDVETKNSALAGEREKLNALTEAMIELSRQPPESFFLQTGLTTDHIHRMILARAVLPRIKEQTEGIVHDLGALDDLKAQMAEQKRLTIAAQKNLGEQRHSLDQLIRVRQGYLQRTEGQKEAIARQLVSLSSEAKDLRQLLEKVSPRHVPGKQAPLHGLSSALKWPVSGRVLHRYGERDADGVTSAGVTFAALPGAPVVAPMPGRVVFAGPFKGYGQIVILQHDGGYHSFLAGFGRIDAEMEQDVEAGEPLGVMPVKTGARPELYFEWRRNNEPVDPAGKIRVLGSGVRARRSEK